jgi:plasmid stabilization system protein ParE
VTWQLILSREAREDIRSAVAYLRGISPRLSVRFSIELETVYSAILDHPQLYPVIYKDFRRALLNRFPYSVFYVVDASVVLIVGVVHQARDEETWRRRS